MLVQMVFNHIIRTKYTKKFRNDILVNFLNIFNMYQAFIGVIRILISIVDFKHFHENHHRINNRLSFIFVGLPQQL